MSIEPSLVPILPIAVAPAVAIVRVAVIVVSLVLWFWTQKLLAGRATTMPATGTTGAITDGIHNLTAKIHAGLIANPKRADWLLISSSAVIDVLGFYLLGASIFGSTFQPFLGLLIVFALRQFCQMLCPLPCPDGMIWRSPGVPTILVTYGTSTDLFFSGHTAIAVYGAACLASAFGPIGIMLGTAIVIFEVGTVLVLRAHYTMDVFAGAITALYVHRLSIDLAPRVNEWIAHLVAMMPG